VTTTLRSCLTCPQPHMRQMHRTPRPATAAHRAPRPGVGAHVRPQGCAGV
jgi:hypothetical protein